MNLASWIILLVIIGIAVLALRATFRKKKRGGCCDVGDDLNVELQCSCSSCQGCSMASTCSHALEPRFLPRDAGEDNK